LNGFGTSRARSDDVQMHMDGLVPSSGSNGDTTVESVHGLAGAWKLTGSQASGFGVCEKMSSLIIEGNHLFLADGASCIIAFGIEANTLRFQDSIFELVADDIAWLHCTGSSGLACYQRVHLPSSSYLLTIQGSWQCHGTRFGLSSPQDLTIQGAFWHIRDGHTSKRGVVHMHRLNGDVMIGDRKIRIIQGGNLSLHRSHQNVLAFHRPAASVQNWMPPGR